MSNDSFDIWFSIVMNLITITGAGFSAWYAFGPFTRKGKEKAESDRIFRRNIKNHPLLKKHHLDNKDDA